MSRTAVRERLAAGPGRGLGCAAEIAGEALTSPAILKELVAAASDSRAVVSTRAANALKKVQDTAPELLTPHAGKLVRCALACEELRTRWNLTLIAGALPVRGRDRKLAIDLMFESLGSPSAFLRTFAVQGLVGLCDGDDSLKLRVREAVERAASDSSAAVRARARKLLALL